MVDKGRGKKQSVISERLERLERERMERDRKLRDQYLLQHPNRQTTQRVTPGKLTPLTPAEHELFQMGRSRIGGQTTTAVQSSLHMQISDEICVSWKPDEPQAFDPVCSDDAMGSQLAPPRATAGTARELVLGLDFGTSSTKVVVADRALDKAYAVPFVSAVGIASYLLPSALLETSSGQYVLTGSGARHTDLKLTMLANKADDQACARVCAFLALVIRQSRAWLYQSHADQFLRADILWTLVIGQPADQTYSQQDRRHFEDLAKVAWSLAGREGGIGSDEALETWRRRAALDLEDELEVNAIAELSAQIHGFVSSSHFDPHESNIYLLVDVGAGTSDASLFRVQKERDGRVSIGLFTHAVELLGVANLNRRRVDWWQTQLRDKAQRSRALNARMTERIEAVIGELDALKLPTEFRGRVPKCFRHYLNGVEVEFRDGAKSPDETFMRRLRNQAVGKVLLGAWKQHLLGQEAIKETPFFLCGGGSRHEFYEGLEHQLSKTPNCSWLSARRRKLTFPSNMVAPGVAQGDYDRLSVAYGLSQLHQKAFERMAALEPIFFKSDQSEWDISLTDKSVC